MASMPVAKNTLIRPALCEELPELFRRMGQIDPWSTLQISAESLMESTLNDPLRSVMVAEVNRQIAGCIVFRTIKGCEHLYKIGADRPAWGDSAGTEKDRKLPDGGYVHLLAVFNGFQGSGIGRQLIETASSAMRESQQANLYLCVSDFNTAARQFYQRLGFLQIGTIENCIRHGNSEHVLCLKL